MGEPGPVVADSRLGYLNVASSAVPAVFTDCADPALFVAEDLIATVALKRADDRWAVLSGKQLTACQFLPSMCLHEGEGFPDPVAVNVLRRSGFPGRVGSSGHS